MATLYRADGRVEPRSPAHGRHFQLEELHAMVGGYIELVHLVGGSAGQLLVVNEDGIALGLPYNPRATAIARASLGQGDYIKGDALLCLEREIR